ncbi:nitric oxide synthase-interacting protein-like [Sycon ciliatum]|uniref:nitric oxide synthase-interacting protein-like n=1 Tax=Sycon ciliatum TaxID=27933 RepID=UPI0031F67CDA
MTRHGRNSTANPVLSYHERKAASERSGYGSLKKRLGKDSIKEFDCCCLTLQPCKDPIITPEGYLYDREPILENLLHQKQAISKQLREFERQKEKLDAEEVLVANADQIARKKQFLDAEQQITTKRVNPYAPAATDTVPVATVAATSATSSGAGTSEAARAPAAAGASATGASATGKSANSSSKDSKSLPSFWVPSLTPQAKPTLIKKPDKHATCPMSGKTLRLKDLIAVHFKRINDDDDRPDVAKKLRYRCEISGDELGNHVPCVVLRKSGVVLTLGCFEKTVRKDMVDPTTGDKLQEKDIIRIKGGTGFAHSAAEEGQKLEAKAPRPVAQF